MHLRSTQSEFAVEPNQDLAVVIAAGEKWCLDVDRDAIARQLGNDLEGGDGSLVRMNEVPGHLEMFADDGQVLSRLDQKLHPELAAATQHLGMV